MAINHEPSTMNPLATIFLQMNVILKNGNAFAMKTLQLKHFIQFVLKKTGWYALVNWFNR